MQHFKAPALVPTLDPGSITIFLAGTIDMGAATEWQQAFVDRFTLGRPRRTDDLVIFNPRRDDWDPTWEAKITNPNFCEQVNWEMDKLDEANIIAMYFEGGSKSPITLAELGLHAKDDRLIVYCPDNYWRKGNVDIIGHRHKFPVYSDEAEWFAAIDRTIKYHRSCLDLDSRVDLRTPAQWLEEMGPNAPIILDPDGWRFDDGVTMETSITRADFNFRLQHCTCMNYNLAK